MPLVSVLSAQIRPEKFTRYEELLQTLAQQAVAKQDEAHYTTHQTAFGDVGTIYFVTQDENWAALAGRGTPDALVQRVLGEEAGRRLLEEINECTLAVRHDIAVDRPELSYPPDDVQATYPAAVVTTLRARPGRQEACEELLRKIAEAIPKQDDPGRIITHQTLIGDLSEYFVVRPLSDLAALDAQLPADELLTRAFGPAEGGLIFRSGQEAMEQVKRNIVVYREDLSNATVR